MIRHARRDDTATYECRAQGAIGPAAIARANVSVLPQVTAAPDTRKFHKFIIFVLSCMVMDDFQPNNINS